MSFEFNFKPEPFHGYTQFDELESVDTEVGASSVIDSRIDVHAQFVLQRMFKGDSAAQKVATEMLAAVKEGPLAGIYKVDQLVPAMRAKKFGIGWWQVIPSQEDAAILLDPDNPKTGSPVIVFRDRVKTIAASLDAALRKAWEAFKRLQAVNPSQCSRVFDDDSVAVRQFFGTPLTGVVPAMACQVPNVSPRPILAFANNYINPHLGNETAELNALTTSVWEPSNPDFVAIAQRSSAPLKVATDSLQTLLNVINAELPGSISKLFLVGHSSTTVFSFSGSIGTQMVGGRLRSRVGFDLGRAITRANMEDDAIASFISRNRLSNRFAPGAEIILVGCNTGTRGELFEVLSNAFKVCVRGFVRKVCVFLGHTQGRITSRSRITSRGRVKYDSTGRLTCDRLDALPFIDDVLQLTPDAGPSCIGVTTSSRQAGAFTRGMALRLPR